MLLIKEVPYKWWVLGAMSSVLGLVLLDETVVGVALPTIQADLGMSPVLSDWVINSYLLVFACLVAVAGRLGDSVGLKTLCVGGLSIFGLASLMAGFAHDSVWLITARAVQGIGGAAIFPVSMAIITTVFPAEQRGLALAVYGSVGGIFLVAGPFLGGLFTGYLSWRWIFWVNLPLVVVVAGVISASDVSSSTGASATTDYIGIITLVFGLCALVFAIMQGPVWHWSAPVIVILLVSGVLLLLGLIVVELRVSPEPLLDLHLFRNATFSGSILLIFVAQFSKISVVVFVPEYLQEVLGMSPFATGLALLPAMVPVPITGIVVARLVDRVGVRWFCLVGLSMIGVSLSWIAFSVSLRSYALFAPVLVVWGIGLSFVFSPPRKAIFDVVSPSKRGQSSGLAYSAQLLGSTIGMAICSSLFAMIGSLWVVFFVSAVMAFAALVVCWFSIGYSTRQPTTPHSYMLA